MAGRSLALIAALCLAASALRAQALPQAASVIGAVDLDTLSQVVRELSGDVPVSVDGRQVTIASRDHTTPANWAAEYLCAKLESYGYTVHSEYYGTQGRNLYAFARHAELPKQYYILSAHYDAFPYLPDAPGADDDASGVAVVLEAARLLKDSPSRYGLMFAFWDEEEITPGMYGSAHYADSVALVRDSIRGVINCELLGWDGNGDDAMTIHVRPIANSEALAQTMLLVNTTYAIGLHPTVIDPGERKSDHASFWDQEYGALMQVQDVYADLNPGYHSYADVFSQFAPAYYHKMAKLAIGTILQLIEVGQALPVELTRLSARVEGARVRLRWTTASETDNYGFDVERARQDGETARWERLGFVAGAGTSSAPHDYAFDDDPHAKEGRILYRLKQIDRDGACRYSGECRVEIAGAPARWQLCQNYPNPFNPSTAIAYETPQAGRVRLTVFDLLGRNVAVLVDEVQCAGRHRAVWKASGLPSGIYLFRLEAGAQAETRRMLLLR